MPWVAVPSLWEMAPGGELSWLGALSALVVGVLIGLVLAARSPY